ncbi:hypothetical protein LTSEGIV_5863, partial [Salmonella enterica subsp. enterica serovar Give str. S5-487]
APYVADCRAKAPVANDTHVAEVISAPQANDTTFTDEDLA